MARSDLLVALVKAGTGGDKKAARTVAEAIIAEEQAKQHTILADRLIQAVDETSKHSWTDPTNSESPSRSREPIEEVVPRRRLQDIILAEPSRISVCQLIEEQFRADLLRAHGLEPQHRILFVGPPGTGKTTLAEAIAEALSVPLLIVRYESIIGSYLGETAGRLKRVFDFARTRPCVLFFDEFDAIGKERGDTHETGEIKRVVSSLLMQVDDAPSYTIIIAATNHPELLDRAAWRRFQLRILLPMPSQRAVASYIEAYSSTFEQPLGLSPLTIARKLGPVSYADVEQFCVSVRRQEILSLGSRPLKAIVREQLQRWTERAQQGSIGDSDRDG